MPLMEWSPALDIGVEAMNREHRDILAAMNAVYDGVHAGERGPRILGKIERLAQITTRHFADEERYMAQMGFPGLETHKAIHARLLADFSAHVRTIEQAHGEVHKQFFSFLQLWLSAHIKCIDRKYGDHARAIGSRAA